jgi:hypothetical protein
MFWWFEREGSYLRCEVLALSTGGYELRTVTPDGAEHVEHIHDVDHLSERQDAVMEQIVRDGWTGPYGAPR